MFFEISAYLVNIYKKILKKMPMVLSVIGINVLSFVLQGMNAELNKYK